MNEVKEKIKTNKKKYDVINSFSKHYSKNKQKDIGKIPKGKV